MNPEKQAEYKRLKNIYYVFALLISYGIPITYFGVKYGITKEVTQFVMPFVFSILLLAIKVAVDTPAWVGTWEPSVKKGLVKGLPKILLFVFLVTLGLLIRYMLQRQIDVAFVSYFETVFILFGSIAVGTVIEAYHLKYLELYQISKGYVLGVVNK